MRQANVYLCNDSGVQWCRWWSCANAITLQQFHDRRQPFPLWLPAGTYPGASALRAAATDEPAIFAALSELSARERDAIETPCHVLVPRQGGLRSSEKIIRHGTVMVPPRGSFLKVADHVYVCAPEFLFLQMAARLSFGELVALGYELCGCYSLPEELGRPAMVRAPLTTPGRLRAYAAKAGGVKGVKLARLAAAQVLPKSASPMETELAAVAFTSARQGGLGLPVGLLNEPVVLGDRARKASGRERVVCDILWPSSGWALEYNSRDFHASPGAQDRDSAKQDALLMEGVRTVTMTAGQFRNETRCASMLDHLSGELGKPKRKRGASHVEKHGRLRYGMRSFHKRHFGF